MDCGLSTVLLILHLGYTQREKERERKRDGRPQSMNRKSSANCNHKLTERRIRSGRGTSSGGEGAIDFSTLNGYWFRPSPTPAPTTLARCQLLAR